MYPALKEHIQRLAASCWKPYRADAEAESECADGLNYWPEAEDEKAFGPLRWVAIRVRKRQGELFGDGSEAKYFAVVTNLGEWETKRLLVWHREKGTAVRPPGRQCRLVATGKRLRFLIFNTAGRVIHHARSVLCRIAGEGWQQWMRLMPLPTG